MQQYVMNTFYCLKKVVIGLTNSAVYNENRSTMIICNCLIREYKNALFVNATNFVGTVD